MRHRQSRFFGLANLQLVHEPVQVAPRYAQCARAFRFIPARLAQGVLKLGPISIGMLADGQELGIVCFRLVVIARKLTFGNSVAIPAIAETKNTRQYREDS